VFIGELVLLAEEKWELFCHALECILLVRIVVELVNAVELV